MKVLLSLALSAGFVAVSAQASANEVVRDAAGNYPGTVFVTENCTSGDTCSVYVMYIASQRLIHNGDYWVDGCTETGNGKEVTCDANALAAPTPVN